MADPATWAAIGTWASSAEGAATIATTATATAGSVYGGMQQAKAGAAFSQSAKLQRQAQDLQSARQRSDAIRQARMSMADVTQAGANQGSLGSSSSQGGRASIASQLGANLSFLDQYSNLTRQAGIAESAGNQANVNAAMGSSIASIGWQAAGWVGSAAGKAKIAGIFKPKGI